MVILSAALLLFGCAGGDPASDEAGVLDLESYEGLSAALADGDDILLYDVRTKEEYISGHIPGAVNIPHDVIADEIQIEQKDAVIVVYCRSGNRSGQAKTALEGLGYTNVIDFGGIGNWQGDLATGDNPG